MLLAMVMSVAMAILGRDGGPPLDREMGGEGPPFGQRWGRGAIPAEREGVGAEGGPTKHRSSSCWGAVCSGTVSSRACAGPISCDREERETEGDRKRERESKSERERMVGTT